jgi:Protein of unknown function (DUF4242)
MSPIRRFAAALAGLAGALLAFATAFPAMAGTMSVPRYGPPSSGRRRRADSPGDGAGMSAGTPSARAWLSFRRIVDIPFGTCVAALDSWQLTGPDSGRRPGRPLVCGPAEHDPDTGTCRVQVRLGRGPLRPLLRMRLQADHWSSSPPRTALELIPCGAARPSAAYFRAGHLLLDTLARSLARQEHQPTRRQEHDMALFMDYHEDLKLPAQAIAQIAEDARAARADRFGVRQVELYHNPDGKVYCLLEGPDEDAIREHHAALGVPCADVHQVDNVT